MYTIVSSSNNFLSSAISEVEKKVNKLKSEGWVEQGGVSVSSMGTNGLYVVAQSMKK